MAKLTFLLICITFLVFSCKREEWVEIKLPPQPEYLIFGHFYGVCGGETCREIFRLEKDKLFEDTLDGMPPYGSSFYYGQYKQLPEEKFNITKDIVASFPIGLLNETGSIIGMPDAGDWGGLYIEYNFNGTRKMWLIDMIKAHVPVQYHNFIDSVNKKIRLLQ